MRVVLLQTRCKSCGLQNRVAISARNSSSPKCGGCGDGLFTKFAVLSGCVYILSNPAMRGLVKIGQTKGELQRRVDQLSAATAVPSPFIVEAYFLSQRPRDEEALAHSELKNFRHHAGREFFKLGLNDAIDRCRNALRRGPNYIRESDGPFREP